MSDIINGLPNVCGDESKIVRSKATQKKSFYSSVSNINFPNVRASFGIALHMHQPTILAWPNDLWKSPMISNLQSMMDNQHIGDNHNAPVFMQCYKRISWIVRDLVNQGKNPRVMLDYSGNLLWGLKQMENGSAIEELKNIICNPNYYKNVEWLGTMWSHAVASSTPVPDLKLHMLAWRKYFGSLFGAEALDRVKGFSPPEMHLPIHPDVCYEYIKALKECGYEWLMVQEHTVENLDGSGIRRPHFPHRLVARNSLGETQEIIALIKTQGSDTKLVAQMQPYYHAKGLNREDYGGKNIPPFVCQIGDGENGGVMMNEFPPMYQQTFNEIGGGTEGVVAMNGSEYLEFVKSQGIKDDEFITIQPISQKRIWDKVNGQYKKGACDEAIDMVKKEDNRFNLDKGSWTSDRSWIAGYDNVLTPMNRLSAEFHKVFDGKADTNSEKYRQSLLYLMLSETSCFRYWGEGIWTEYAKEFCRRGLESLTRI